MKKIHVPAAAFSLGEAFYWFRSQRLLTVRAAAMALGVSPARLNDVEHERAVFAKGEAKALAITASKVFGTYVADLELRIGRVRKMPASLRKNPELLEVLRLMKACGRGQLILDRMRVTVGDRDTERVQGMLSARVKTAARIGKR